MNDATYLRELADICLDLAGGDNIHDRLLGIARRLENPERATLEQRVEAALAECAEGWADDTESNEGLMAALWLIQRRLGQR